MTPRFIGDILLKSRVHTGAFFVHREHSMVHRRYSRVHRGHSFGE